MSEPSFSNGFASPWYGGRMKYPDLWRGCVGAWSPLLGPTGATLFDVSGFCRHGTLTNMDPATDWVINKGGHTLDFDGSNDLVSLPPSVNECTANDVTAAAWVVTKVTGAYQNIFRNDGGSGGNYGFMFRIEASNVIGLGLFFPFQYFAANTAIAVNTLTHAAVVVRGSTYEIYLNGILDKTGAATPLSQGSNAGVAYLGNYGGGEVLNGQINEFTMWDRALSPSEIRMLAQRPGIMLEMDDEQYGSAAEAAAFKAWYARRQALIIGGGVS